MGRAAARTLPRTRCAWVTSDPAYLEYHDREWGVPNHDDRHLFEMLVLEGAQAGLSWLTILRKREGYRLAFRGFDPTRVARFDRRKIERLLADPAIVRNRAKIEAAVDSARVFCDIRDASGSFDRFVWDFVGGRPKINRWQSLADVPTSTPEAQALSRELKRLGMRFVGPTICYSFMQAVGMVNDHTTDCFRHRALS